ncbi:MAG: hypothetical protein JXA52_08930 [Planctomycetes bacterium]|nr:hypothetical protein [Planctomycetota bacterium]
MAEETFISFDETMQRLGMTEEQLMEEVAANRLRSYMKDREMNFKAAEVETLAANLNLAAIPPKDVPQDSGEIFLVESNEDTVEEKPIELVSQEEDSDIDLKPDSSEIELISISEKKESAAAAEAAPPPAPAAPPAPKKDETESDEIIFADDDISFDLDDVNIAAGIEEVEDTDLIGTVEAKPERMAVGSATVQTEVIETDDLAPSLEQPAVSLASVRSESAKSGMISPYRAQISDVPTVWYVLLVACLVLAIFPLTALFTAVFQDTPLLMRGDDGKVITDSSGAFVPEPIASVAKVLKAKEWWGAPSLKKAAPLPSTPQPRAARTAPAAATTSAPSAAEPTAEEAAPAPEAAEPAAEAVEPALEAETPAE